jgi:hypothetical protein
MSQGGVFVEIASVCEYGSLLMECWKSLALFCGTCRGSRPDRVKTIRKASARVVFVIFATR